MVLPLLAMAAGYGLQAYGSSQRSAAQNAALTHYKQMQGQLGGARSAEDRQIQAYLDSLAAQYRGRTADLVQQFNPQDRIASFNGGMAQQGQGIQQVLDAVNARNQPYAPTSSGLFANAQANEAARVQGATAPVASAAQLSGGLNALATRDNRVGADFSTDAGQYNRAIQDAMRLYAQSNAVRNAALSRADMQNQSDMQKAQNVGSGAMYAGGLINTLGQAYGSYQANQPGTAVSAPYSAADQSIGTTGQLQGQLSPYSQNLSYGG